MVLNIYTYSEYINDEHILFNNNNNMYIVCTTYKSQYHIVHDLYIKNKQ